ncbi:MAG: TlpA family protein disulfide reductase [Planctomycetota bacterium]|nr:TlpA family protein disulfide reductase [Planctomycetota bacterium]
MRLLLACLLALLLCAPVGAEDAAPPLATPSVAWGQMNQTAQVLPYAQRAAALQAAAQEYLAAFAHRGAMAMGAEALPLGLIQRAGEQWRAAAATFRAAWVTEENPENVRDSGALQESSLLMVEAYRALLRPEATQGGVTLLRGYAEGMAGDGRQTLRSSVESNLADVLEAEKRELEAHALRVAIVTRDPSAVARLYRALVFGLLHRTHKLAEYDAVRKDADGLLGLLSAQQAQAIVLAEARAAEALAELKAASPESLNEQGALKAKPANQMTPLERNASGATRAVASAKSLATRLEGSRQPFDMLGRPTPDWTLEHAFGDLKALPELKGKVVVLDFWATWCPWCIRSFPAIRDLLRDYESKGLVVVGVTASANSVYAARYDLDDDLKDKVVAGERVQPTARVAQGAQQPDGETLFTAEAYVEKEREVIRAFIANHQMTWPVVMIDKQEPGPKFALTGWPHAVVLDRAGRVRHFKSGALLRDRADAVKEFRALLDALLAEAAE